MTQTEITIKFTTYDGQPGSRPPIFDPATPGADTPSSPHEWDGCHYELMLIPAGQEKPLSMAFMLFPINGGAFEWCSKYSAKELSDEEGTEVALDEAGNICFPLQVGDLWALWPGLTPDQH